MLSGVIEVPLLDLRAQYAEIRSEIEAAVKSVLETQHFIAGPELAGFEEELAAYCETAHARGCASGSDALLLALMGIGVGPGDEVVCPSFSFFATASSISRLGAIPVFADIDPATYNADPAALRKCAEGCTRLRAILPVGLFGQSPDMEAVLEIAREHEVHVIEDAAQAIGARDAQGRPAGSRVPFGCFSFYPTKNLGAYGDGGAITTNDEAGARRIEVLRDHGGETRYHHRIVGVNSRLDALQAAVLRVKLRHLDVWSERRRANARFYDGAFAARGATDSSAAMNRDGLPVRTPRPAPAPARHIYNQYVIRVPAERREGVRLTLRERGIGTEIYYPLGLHQQECFAELGYAAGDLPETEAAAREVLAIPVYPELREEQLEYVVEQVCATVS